VRTVVIIAQLKRRRRRGRRRRRRRMIAEETVWDVTGQDRWNAEGTALFPSLDHMNLAESRLWTSTCIDTEPGPEPRNGPGSHC
jgi:hypothetical protein